MKFEIYKDRAGKYRWRLKANNHKIIADSGQGYKRKRDCKRGITLVCWYGKSLSTKKELDNSIKEAGNIIGVDKSVLLHINYCNKSPTFYVNYYPPGQPNIRML